MKGGETPIIVILTEVSPWHTSFRLESIEYRGTVRKKYDFSTPSNLDFYWKSLKFNPFLKIFLKIRVSLDGARTPPQSWILVSSIDVYWWNWGISNNNRVLNFGNIGFSNIFTKFRSFRNYANQLFDDAILCKIEF